ncbi:LPXTG cell wall anchor domain-containing protein [Plantactinospora sp. S1510]|uniref:LPXTG cell wall anchor domain-containing protein n=1 Tax=Plantactinospora alkalitolerans TaxID=2789879 RepID=A0ABS0H0L1_9ACTN|nr:LPXTG cell wall anchor domain-containing protein [Plantactinospora alkalitolerans]MBF9131851.1 LPXTG cell wall anchor domain-containing protein [Plantactinospora alkalitolerans]
MEEYGDGVPGQMAVIVLLKGIEMRPLRIVLAALLFAAAGPLAATPASAAADTAPPTLGDITISPDTVDVAGLDLIPVTVAVRLRDESGVVQSGEVGGGMTPFVGLQRVSGGSGHNLAGGELALTSGTVQDGIWSVTIQVPSTWDGRWEVNHVVADDAVAKRLDVDPRTAGQTVTLDVTGTHQPAVSMQFSPDPLVGDGPLTVKGRFYFKDTNRGIPNQPIFFGADNLCVEYDATPNGRTAADGTFSKTYPKGDGFLRCVGILRPSNSAFQPAFIVVTSGHPRVRPAVTATASRTSVTAGTKITISGTALPFGVAGTVRLQQLRNSSWRTLGSTQVDDRGRYTFDVRPQTAGANRYRVISPGSEEDLTGVSPTLVVTVGSSGGGGGDDETLPITGPAPLPMAGGAGILLLVGAGLLLFGRRRRIAA